MRPAPSVTQKTPIPGIVTALLSLTCMSLVGNDFPFSRGAREPSSSRDKGPMSDGKDTRRTWHGPWSG